MEKILEKRERSLGVKLGIKGDRCSSPKCALIRKPYKPGQHGKKRRRKLSEYGTQLLEKQKVKFTYGLTEKQLRRIYVKASEKPEATTDEMVRILESRLDNIIFRAGLAPSRPAAKQFISHGHFTVNGRKVTIPSILLKEEDRVSVRTESRTVPELKELPEKLKNFEAPSWFTLNKETLEIIITGKPIDVPQPFDINMVVDYYS